MSGNSSRDSTRGCLRFPGRSSRAFICDSDMRKCGVCDNNLCLMLLKPRSMPYRASAITALKTFFYDKGPAAFPMTLHVAVPAGINPDSQQSEMRRISPEEMEFAFLEAIVDAIRRKAPKSELQAWRYHLLTVSYCYVLLDNEDDIAFAATRYRESLEQKFTSMQHTVYQKMMGVVYMIKRLAKTKGRLSSKQVEQLYQDKVGTANEHADGKEALSSNFIDTAVTFYERVGLVCVLVFARGARCQTGGKKRPLIPRP